MYTCPQCQFPNKDTARFCQQCGRPLGTGKLPAGHVLNGRYAIGRLLGQGGMGAVYEVSDLTQVGVRRAVKEMSDAGLTAGQRPAAIASFRREAQILAGLSHPNLPRVFEFFEYGGKHYLVMEYVEGRNLEKALEAAAGPLPEDLVTGWIAQVCDVLGYLHSQTPPIIFRDMKPANIMLTPSGQVKLIDFGIARFFKPGQTRDTEAFGTLGYASPEAATAQTDARSDVYSLGATLHVLLTHHDFSKTIVLPPPQTLRPTLSPRVVAVINRATQHNPALRFQSAAEMKQALLSTPAGPAVPAPAASSPPASVTPTVPAGWAATVPVNPAVGQAVPPAWISPTPAPSPAPPGGYAPPPGAGWPAARNPYPAGPGAIGRPRRSKLAPVLLCVVALLGLAAAGVGVWSLFFRDGATAALPPAGVTRTAVPPSRTPLSGVPPAPATTQAVPSEPTEVVALPPTSTRTHTPLPPSPTVTPTRTPLPVPPTSTSTPTPPCPVLPQGEFASAWQSYAGRLGCPLQARPFVVQDAEQQFQYGHMFWRADRDFAYVVYQQGSLAGTYQARDEPWSEGMPEYSCSASPPAGLVQPKRGFGYAWCRLGAANAPIGWALSVEAGFGAGNGDPLVQDFERGTIFRDSDGTSNGMAYVFFSDGTFVRIRY